MTPETHVAFTLNYRPLILYQMLSNLRAMPQLAYITNFKLKQGNLETAHSNLLKEKRLRHVIQRGLD